MINYRNATIDDVKTIKELSIKLCEWESKEFDNKYNGLNPGTKEGIEAITDAIKSDVYIILIAENESKPIGFLLGGISESAYHWNFNKLAELHKLYVEDKYRGQGIGDELMKRFIEFSENNDADRMEIYTFYENSVNDFYEKYGFEKKALFLRKDLK